MATMSSVFSPPLNRGMTVLDRNQFDKDVPVLAVRVRAPRTHHILKGDPLRQYILRTLKLHNVVPDSDGDSASSEGDPHRLVLLNVADKDSLSPAARDFIALQDAALVPHTLHLNYSNWSTEQILHSVLPEELSDAAPSSFTITGHLAHYNLRDEYLPYKNLIGQVTLDKNPTLRTVVNKLDQIDTQFRFFKMELLAGVPEYIVEAHESNCKFHFDFSLVYWNSRLHTEHERLVSSFQPGDVVADVFAGVGPFAVPAAKNKGCLGYANDLNPESTLWLGRNVILNGVEDYISVSTLDGRAFIKHAILEAWHRPKPTPGPYVSARRKARESRRARQPKPKPPSHPASASASDSNPPRESKSPSESKYEHKPTPEDAHTDPRPEAEAEAEAASAQRTGDARNRRIDHFVMNLPDTAVLFLDAFRGCLSQLWARSSSNSDLDYQPRVGADVDADVQREVREVYKVLPMVHCYSFTRELELAGAERDLRERAQAAMGHPLPEGEATTFYLVRRVAPNKDMYCISFRLPEHVAFES